MKQSKLRKSKESAQKQESKNERESCINEDEALTKSKITLVIEDENNLKRVPKIYHNYEVYLLPNGNISACHLIQQLQTQKMLREQSAVSYFLQNGGYYVFGLLVPQSGNSLEKEFEIESKFFNHNTLRIKIRSKPKISVAELIEEQRIKYEDTEEDKSTKGQKEKKICEVIEKVALWRKFYTGFYDESRNYIQKQLDVAAQEVGIAKKTLDDYLLQIRNGKKYGFNFNQKYNSKIGELRSFVRDQKKREPTKQI